MTAITTINSGDLISNSRTDINSNFAALNSGKVETSLVSTDATLGGSTPSSTKLPVESAVKSYVDSVASPVGKSWNEYAVANSGSDSYTITVPGVTTYVEGQTFKFKADVANTGACSLNVNGLGAKSLKNSVSSDLVTGNILLGQDVVVIYDGTNMQVISALSQSISASSNVIVYTGSIYGKRATLFNVTNPSGSTFRYTYVSGYGNPGITSITFPIGSPVDVQISQLSAGNKGQFIITGSGANYFEVTNSSGVVESSKEIGEGYLNVGGIYTKPTGLKYLSIKMVGGGCGGDYASSSTGSSGAYLEKIIQASSISATEIYFVGGGSVGGTSNTSDGTACFGSSSMFIGRVAGGAKNSLQSNTPGVATGGDINIDGILGDTNRGGGTSLGISPTAYNLTGSGYGYGAGKGGLS